MLRFIPPLVLFAASVGLAQGRYPVVPTPLPDAEELALATSAAPPEISAKADVYTFKAGKPVKVRAGSSGAACMVARDLHEGSAYPICYDAEGVRTRMQRELMEVGLRMSGAAEDEIERRVAAAYDKGELKRPGKITVAYMTSPRQVIFSSARAEGRRVGAWWPHLMITAPGLSAAGLGIPPNASLGGFSIDAIDGHHNELVVQLHTWSDGTPVKR
jgi:hypothetical protein